MKYNVLEKSAFVPFGKVDQIEEKLVNHEINVFGVNDSDLVETFESENDKDAILYFEQKYNASVGRVIAGYEVHFFELEKLDGYDKEREEFTMFDIIDETSLYPDKIVSTILVESEIDLDCMDNKNHVYESPAGRSYFGFECKEMEAGTWYELGYFG